MTIEDDVEAFARLQVELQRPFVVRATVLHRAGIGEHSLRDAQRRWAARFIAPDGAAWRERYRAAFDRSSTGRAESSTYRAAEVDATLPVVERCEETLPFTAPPPGVVPASVVALKGAGQKEPRASSDGEETLWIPAPVKKEDGR